MVSFLRSNGVEGLLGAHQTVILNAMPPQPMLGAESIVEVIRPGQIGVISALLRGTKLKECATTVR